MALLAAKLLLAPAFVVGASLAARRYGPRVGGLIAGLPVVAGPILLIYALQHGDAFAANASVGALLGLVSLIAFVIVYGRLAPNGFWGHCTLAGWLAFAVATAAFSALHVGAPAALAIAAGALALGLWLAPRPLREPPDPPTAAELGSSDARRRGARARARADCARRLAGPEAERPADAVPDHRHGACTFTHAQQGADSVRRMLRWLLAGYGAFALFCFVLAEALVPLGTIAAFVLASAVALVVQACVIAFVALRMSGPVRTPPSRLAHPFARVGEPQRLVGDQRSAAPRRAADVTKAEGPVARSAASRTSSSTRDKALAVQRVDVAPAKRNVRKR